MSAVTLAETRAHPEQRNNAEEYQYRKVVDGHPAHIANFKMCLPHDETTGLL